LSLLEVTDLRVSFPTADGVVQAVRGVSFSVDTGSILGIVGESGSGKTVLTQTLLGLAPGGNVSGQAMFNGVNLIGLPPGQLRQIRGAQISVIFQDPLTSLHPLYRVGWQIAEMIRTHDKGISRQQANERAIELLGHVGIPQPRQRVNDFPHQFSGGMRQRAMIAMALACNPRVLIADEPTTALDVTIQAQILDLILELQQELGIAIILITHNLGMVAEVAQRVIVMYAGRKVEEADVGSLFAAPLHPYTHGLLGSLPRLGRLDDDVSGEPELLREIPGIVPSLSNLPPGCAFAPRCSFADEPCRATIPRYEELRPSHRVACWHAERLYG